MKQILGIVGLALMAVVSSVSAQPSGNSSGLFLATAGDNTGNLYTVDPITAVPTLIGQTNDGEANVAITGLAFHPTTGVLYGVSANISSSSPRNLVTVNPSTAFVTEIGSLGANPVVDISFRSDGTLFGWRKNGNANPDDLVTINLTNGAVTSVGASGVSNTSGGGLAFLTGTLFLSAKLSIGALSTVNPATGAVTDGPTMDGNGGAIQAMAASPAAVLYAIMGANTLVTINTSTGHITTVGPLTNVSGGDALAFIGSAIQPTTPTVTPTSTATSTPVSTLTPTRTPTTVIAVNVPTVGQYGLLVLGALLAVAGLLLVKLR